MKKLRTILAKKSGRSKGRLTVRHQGGRHKRFLREIDFKRDKKDVWARIQTVEYDPNRNVKIASVVYEDGEKRYILAPEAIKAGNRVIASDAAPVEPGNSLPLAKIPVGTQIHNIEITPGKGGQLVKSAGTFASVFGKEENLPAGKAGFVLVKLPSGEIRRFNPESLASVGQLGNVEAKNLVLGSAGRARRMGIRPSVRGVAMHPAAHPHGGGEGRSSVGLKFPKTPWGKPAVGKTRVKNKYSQKFIVETRRLGRHSRPNA